MQQDPMSHDMVGEKVLAAIESGKAKMRPRWRFVAQAVLIIVTGAIITLGLIYVVSFIVFDLNETGARFTPAFGLVGWYVFFQSLPWVLVFLCAVAILLLAFLIRHYSFGYHWPVIYLLLAITLLAAGGSVFVARTPLYERLFNAGPNEHLFLVGDFYEGFGVPVLDRVYRGEILMNGSSSFTFQDIRGRTSVVLVASDTAFPDGSFFTPGDIVVIFGERTATDTIVADGVSRIIAGNGVTTSLCCALY